MSSCVSVELSCWGCHTESHHEREGLRQQDNAGVCATAPEWRLVLSDRSRLTTTAASTVEVKESGPFDPACGMPRQR